MMENLNETGPIPDAEGAVCEPVCEPLPDSAPERPAAGAPIRESAASGACQHCHATFAGLPQRCPVCGTWQPSNVAAMKHGAYSAQVRAGALEGADPRAGMAEKRARLASDLGHVDSQVKADVIQSYLECDMVRRHVAGQLAAGGIFTERGRIRAAFQAFVAVTDRFLRVAALLGLERQARQVPSARDIIAEYDERQKS